MKRAFTAIVFLLLSELIFGQNRDKDKIGVTANIDAMIYSWNHHNFDDLKNYTTENTDWVNGVGMWWKGRKESQYAHQAYHNTIFKESVVEKDSAFIRFITNDVAIAHIYWHFSAFTDPTGKTIGPDDCIATLVYVRQNGKWLMESGENLTIRKETLEFDPVRKMPKN